MGGALYISYSNTSLQGTAIFEKNSAEEGGGICISFSRFESDTAQVHFINNTAKNKGGAVYAIIVREYSRSILLTANFTRNRAKCGGAIYAEGNDNISLIDTQATGNFGSALCITDCNITFGGSTLLSDNCGIYGGAINSKNSHLAFTGSSSFRDNHGSIGGAIHLLHSTLKLSGFSIVSNNTAVFQGGGIYALGTIVTLVDTVNFTCNSAENGGAMYFKTTASLNLEPRTQLFTSFNYASEYGGALYYEDTPSSLQCNFKQKDGDEITQLPFCFLQFKRTLSPNIRISMTSRNDSAGKDGKYLYGGLLDRCQIRIVTDFLEIKSIVLHRFFKQKILCASAHGKQIASRPYQLCFCEDNENYNCSIVKHIETHRGQRFNISLLSVDQDAALSPTVITATIHSSARLKANQSSQSLPHNCSALNYALYSSEQHEELILYPDGPCRDTGLARAVIEITLLPCPYAFSQDGEECICEKRLQQYNANSIIDENIYITRSADSEFWMDILIRNETYEGLILYKTCPTGYCTNDTVDITLDNTDIQCASNRDGLLCGKCSNGYSLMLGSSKCKKCSNTYLTLLIPFAVAGIALVIFLSFLRLTVATGMINSLILYANIVQVNRDSFFPVTPNNVLTVFIAWLNLDFGFETCFYGGLDAYGQTWLQFAFPAYTWILITLIIFISRYSIRISKLIGSNPIAVLATLLFMSYTKVLKIIIEVYSSVQLDYPDNKTVTVWLKDANVPYLKSKHLLLALVATFALAFLFLPYTMLLLLGHQLYRFMGRKHLRWLIKIKPLLDSYYAPYKKKTRYWTGFLLLVRCALYIVFSFNSLGATTKSLLAVNVTFTALVIVAWLSAAIYRNFYVNVLEASVYLNLIIFSATTLAGANTPEIAHLLVGIVFITMIATIIHHFHLAYTAKSPKWIKVKAKISSFLDSVRALTSNRKITSTAPVVPTDSSSTNPHKVVTKTVIELREPLLEK